MRTGERRRGTAKNSEEEVPCASRGYRLVAGWAPNYRGSIAEAPEAPFWTPLSRFLRLLDLHSCARFFELRLDLVGLFLRDALLDRVGRAVHEVLGLLEAEAGD